MSELSNIYNLRRADSSFRRHGFSKQNHMRPIKVGPEPFNSRILQGIYYMTTTDLPALSRDALDVPFQGTPLKTQGALKFGDNTTKIGFKTAGDFLARNAIEQWMFELGNPLDGTGSYCVGEDSTIQYAIVNDTGRIVRGVEMFGVFPTSVDAISYDNDGVQPTKFTATFAYNYWTPLDISQMELDNFTDVNGYSDSAQTNVSVIYDRYEKLINDREKADDCF